jgi:DNA-binding NarL/FixJ family response regulator
LIEGAGRLQPTVIVLDLSYAAGSLSDLIRDLRDHAPTAKLLLLSVHDEPTVVAAAIAAGADGLVLRRAIGSDLMPAIDSLLAGQRYFASGAAH